MRRKIGLCVVYINHNYGSILQSYATLLKLEDLGYDYEIISYNPRIKMTHAANPYGDGHACERIADILEKGYTEI